MVYFNFNKVTPAAPNDPLVDEVAAMNNNWDQLESKLVPYVNRTTPTGMETGQEYFNSNRFTVWDGAAGKVPDNIEAAWSAWTNFPVFAGRAIRTGFTPKWRNNSLLRIVECTGGFQVDGAASAWTMGTLFVLNADASGSPPSSMTPINSSHVSQAAVGLTAGTSVVASGYVIVDRPGTFVRLRGQYLGGPGGGNFMMLDQVWWYY